MNIRLCLIVSTVFAFGVSLFAESGGGYCFEDQDEKALLKEATVQSLMHLDFVEVSKGDERYVLVQQALRLLEPINFNVGVPLEVDIDLERIYWKGHCFVAIGDVINVDDISILIWGWRKNTELTIKYSFKTEGWN